ncbi:glutathione S-transferase GstA [Verticillium alfalfae VaMs.102]|uniref:Glutathione S-transferase GstA n=1 Tax=Verticillium alfalfae (strain VaMs.102 / ATCC MYA-4576 / FGSC 10136) TaxID=526221 RepID=C9SXB6_VERA1|nr:glutathione S-transferase GstA [Verticillium alfalfae VaMs.102]EEY23306.1 glutathione S-transferase GstA [Verticillium alfalfae VaMs.102]
MAAPKSDIHLYTTGTPNGIKASILLEELGLPYQEPWFLEINPNGRIPALTDSFDDGKPIRIFESGRFLQYLVDRYDKDHKVSYPAGSRETGETTNWLMWQMAASDPCRARPTTSSVCPFSRRDVRASETAPLTSLLGNAPEQIQYGIDRYSFESRRLYRTLDTHLAKSSSGFIVGDKLTVADISCWGWIAAAHWAGIDIEEFPHVKKWLYKLLERPGFEKGRHVPTKHTALESAQKSEEELEKAAAESRQWVQSGMKEDAKN